MKKAALLASLAFTLASGYASAQNTMTSGRPSAVLNDKRCQRVWDEAVPKGDSLAKADASRFIVNFQQADTDHDGTISKDEFWAACKKGLVKYRHWREKK